MLLVLNNISSISQDIAFIYCSILVLDNAHQYANVTILQKSNVIVLQIDKENNIMHLMI